MSEFFDHSRGKGEEKGLDANEALVEAIWVGTQGRVARAQIEQLVREARDDFAHATITTFVPIFVRRQVYEKLAPLLKGVETANVRFGVDPSPVGQPRRQGDRAIETRSGLGIAKWLLKRS